MLALNPDYVTRVVVNERRRTSNALVTRILVLERLSFAMRIAELIVDLLPAKAIVGVCKEIRDSLWRADVGRLCCLICRHLR